MRKLTLKTVTLLVLIASIFSFPNQVNAAEKQNSELDFENYNLIESLTKNEEQMLANKTQELQQKPYALKTQANKKDIDFSKPSYTKLIHKNTQEIVYTISFEILGENDALSSIDIIYDENLNVKYQKEIHIKDYNGSDVSLTTWMNNNQVANVQDTKENLESKAQTQNDENGVTTFASNGGWACISDCLSDAGISMWLIGLIGTVCAGVCLVSAGTGCAPCLVGLGMTQIQVFFDCDTKCSF